MFTHTVFFSSWERSWNYQFVSNCNVMVQCHEAPAALVVPDQGSLIAQTLISVLGKPDSAQQGHGRAGLQIPTARPYYRPTSSPGFDLISGRCPLPGDGAIPVLCLQLWDGLCLPGPALVDPMGSPQWSWPPRCLDTSREEKNRLLKNFQDNLSCYCWIEERGCIF